MGFQFPLAAVLRVRCIAEEQEERLLQKILFEIKQTQDEIDRIANEIAEALREATLGRTLAGYHLQAFYSQAETLNLAKKEQEDKLVKLHELRERQIKAYEDARRNREMLADMREAQQEAYDAELARGEQKRLDDNFIARRGRM